MENKLSQSNKGFTLVEIVVTMVIISILASITTMGLISWQEYSLNMKQDENAELVYMAFRNRLSILMANGAVDDVKDLTSFQLQDEEDESGSGNESGSSDGNMGTTLNKNHCLISNKKDYEQYGLTEKDKKYDSNYHDTTGAKVLLDYISPYIYDKEILNACIAIEYKIKKNNFEIVAVYYSDRCEKFLGSEGIEDSESVKLSSIKKKPKARYEKMVGMYSPN